MPIVLVALLAALMFAAAPTAQNLTKADVEKIVRDYLANRSEDVLLAVEKAEEKRAMAQFRALIQPHVPTAGPANAPVTIVEFSEFQCPFCARVQPTLDHIRKKYGNRVRWAFKQLPLDFHPQAKPAATAALAAHQQGKFWEYTRVLWENQAQLGERLLLSAAQQLKLDMAKFNTDRASKRIADMVAADMRDAAEVGAQGTPYFIINGKAISGALPPEAFEKIIDAHLKMQK